MSQKFCFLNDPYLKFLTCPVCQKVLSHPTRVHRCGHTVCYSCCPALFKLCPCCLLIIEQKQVDITATGLVNDLLVKCTVQGCAFQGTFEEFKANHIKNCIYSGKMSEKEGL